MQHDQLHYPSIADSFAKKKKSLKKYTITHISSALARGGLIIVLGAPREKTEKNPHSVLENSQW